MNYVIGVFSKKNSNSMVETLLNISIQDFDTVSASLPTK